MYLESFTHELLQEIFQIFMIKELPYQRWKQLFCCSAGHGKTSMSTCITCSQSFAKEFSWMLAGLQSKIRYRENIFVLKL